MELSDNQSLLERGIAELELKAQAARASTRKMAGLSTEVKNSALNDIADMLIRRSDEILDANSEDCLSASRSGNQEATLDRLQLNTDRIQSLASSVRNIALLPDPVGESFDSSTMDNGLRIEKRRVPLGVIGTIYESRPAVTVDISALCLKSGNAAILRGGTEAFQSNNILVDIVRSAISEVGVPIDSVQFITCTDRNLVSRMLVMSDEIDLMIPRGGHQLVRRVAKEAKMPAITGGIGVCHTYVDKSADLEMAVEIVNNAKVQRPSVCNAMDTLLVHASVAPEFLPMISRRWAISGVEMRVDSRAMSMIGPVENLKVVPAQDGDWSTEHLSLRAGVRIVDSFEKALEHINSYGSGHSEAIVTEDESEGSRFLEMVDASAVMLNASTRFNDGGEFGLGAEVAISTNKMHARGPIGIRELTSYKWIVVGTGQVRT
ncbi:MAG: glutamate-5-semialdehyde dehydrogenase [Chloroflexota bacterium]|nr:glutamate-5-semialdehyde dehydrogenase [Chloroflexota bacterium]